MRREEGERLSFNVGQNFPLLSLLLLHIVSYLLPLTSSSSHPISLPLSPSHLLILLFTLSYRESAFVGRSACPASAVSHAQPLFPQTRRRGHGDAGREGAVHPDQGEAPRTPGAPDHQLPVLLPLWASGGGAQVHAVAAGKSEYLSTTVYICAYDRCIAIRVLPQVLMKDVATPVPQHEVRGVIKKCLENAALVNYERLSEEARLEGT